MDLEQLTFKNGKTVLNSTGEEVLVELASSPLIHEVPTGISDDQLKTSIEERGKDYQANAYFLGTQISSSPSLQIKTKRGRCMDHQMVYEKTAYSLVYFRVLQILSAKL